MQLLFIAPPGKSLGWGDNVLLAGEKRTNSLAVLTF